MKQVYFVNLMKSNYCRIIFLLGFLGAYFMLPEAVFHHTNRLLAIFYMLSFAVLLTCIVRSIKEKVNLAHRGGASWLGIIGAVLGISAFQVCGIGAPVCGMSVGLGVLSTIFPSFMVGFLMDYGMIIIYFSLFIQLLAIWFLGCFKISKQSIVFNK